MSSDSSEEALGRLFRRKRRLLLWKAWRLVGSREAAEDLVQDAYLRVSEATRRGGVTHLPSFIYRTLRNLAIDHLRAQTVRGGLERADLREDELEQVAAAEASPETQVVALQRLRRLDAALRMLPPRARQVFLLARVEGLGQAEIAERLGVSLSTVEKDLRQAMAHCLEALQRAEG